MNKNKWILLLVACSLIPLMFTVTIPYVLPTKLHLNSLLTSEHSWTNEFKLYVIPLEEGFQYTITVDIDTFWGMDISLRIGETPYMINGFLVEAGLYTGEIMHFTATKTGDYYIQVKTNSGSGYFDIIVESGIIGSATDSNKEFFNPIFLLVFILPSTIILAVGLPIIIKLASRSERKPAFNIYRQTKKEENVGLGNNEDVRFCSYCGVKITKSLKKCPNCQISLK